MNYPTYMDRPEEQAKYAAICKANGYSAPANGARGLCEAMASGDAEVFEVIWTIWNFENAFDDLIDETGIDDDTKVVAISALHDAIMETSGAVQLERFLQAWRFLEVRTRWSKKRRILAATARNHFFSMLHMNRFARAHAQQLKAMLVQTMLRCISGDVMAKSPNERSRALAPAVRCGDVDLFMHIIYLARGFAAASAWCGKLGYDVPDTEPATKETI